MTDIVDYQFILSKAIQTIIRYREPHSPDIYAYNLQWHEVEAENVAPFAAENYQKQHKTIQFVNDVTIQYVYEIISLLFQKYFPDKVCSIDNIGNDPKDKLTPILYSFLDKKNNRLLFLKCLEQGPLAIMKSWKPSYISTACKENNVSDFCIIYFVFDKAYLQFMGHNDDEQDPGRGYHFYSLKWLFLTYFSEDEYTSFKKAMDQYILLVKELIGYVSIRPLFYTSLISFKRILERHIIKHQYDSLLSIKLQDKKQPNRVYTLNQNDCNLIRQYYINAEHYLALLGTSSFAESFVTAEWLYSSMEKAHAIDLSVIGMGYCKAIEQLLYEIICTYADQNLLIGSMRSSTPIVLSQTAIDNEEVDSSIGSMAVFVRENKDIVFNNAISNHGKNYIKEWIFKFADIRNEYFHKTNIHNWKKIREIRDTAFKMAFLILGACQFNQTAKEKMKYPDRSYYSDYYKLCEYVNYHCEEHYIFEFSNGDEDWAIGRGDFFQQVKDDHIEYSGVYFSPFTKSDKIIRLNETNLPAKIYLAFLKIGHDPITEQIKLTSPEKTRLIYTNGKYVGPLLYEGIDY